MIRDGMIFRHGRPMVGTLFSSPHGTARNRFGPCWRMARTSNSSHVKAEIQCPTGASSKNFKCLIFSRDSHWRHEVNSKRNWIVILGTLALLMAVSGCKKPTPPPVVKTPPPEVKPVTATLSANPTSIERGQQATLTWSTENATDVAIQGQKVDPSGSQSVSPTQSTD